jgi:hypothetical protein
LGFKTRSVVGVKTRIAFQDGRIANVVRARIVVIADERLARHTCVGVFITDFGLTPVAAVTDFLRFVRRVASIRFFIACDVRTEQIVRAYCR